MTHYPDARRYLRELLEEDWGRSYPSVLGNMTGMLIRSESMSPARQKTVRAQAEGLRLACMIILRNEYDLNEDAAGRIIREHEERWREATAEDEAAMEAAR